MMERIDRIPDSAQRRWRGPFCLRIDACAGRNPGARFRSATSPLRATRFLGIAAHARALPGGQRVTVGGRMFETQPLFADQELDARLTGSAIYWEGASTLSENGRRVGRGYLELTGYAAPLAL